jgi:hypothetical protein
MSRKKIKRALYTAHPSELPGLVRAFRIQDDKELAWIAVRRNHFVFRELSINLKSDRDLVKWAVKRNGLHLRWANPMFLIDREVALLACKSYGYAIQLVSLEFTNDPEFILAIIRAAGSRFYFYIYDSRFSNNREIMIAALKSTKPASRIYNGTREHRTLLKDPEVIHALLGIQPVTAPYDT